MREKAERVNGWIRRHQLKILGIFGLSGLGLMGYNVSQFTSVYQQVKEAKVQPTPTISWRARGVQYPEPKLLESGLQSAMLADLETQHLVGKAENLRMDWTREQSILKTMTRFLEKGDIDSVLSLRRKYPGIMNRDPVEGYPLASFDRQMTQAHLRQQKDLAQHLERYWEDLTDSDNIEDLRRVARALRRPSPAHYLLLTQRLPSPLLTVYLNNVHATCRTELPHSDTLVRRLIFSPALKNRLSGQIFSGMEPEVPVPFAGAEIFHRHQLAMRIYGPILREMVSEIQSTWNNGNEEVKQWLRQALGSTFTRWLDRSEPMKVSDLELVENYTRLENEIRHFWSLRIAKTFRERNSIQVLPHDFFDNDVLGVLDEEVDIDVFSRLVLGHPEWRQKLLAFEHEEAISFLETALNGLFCANVFEYMAHTLQESLAEELTIMTETEFNWSVLAGRFELTTTIPQALMDLEINPELNPKFRERPKGTKQWEELTAEQLLKYFIEKSKTHPTGRFRYQFSQLAKAWARNRGLFPSRKES